MVHLVGFSVGILNTQREDVLNTFKLVTCGIYQVTVIAKGGMAFHL